MLHAAEQFDVSRCHGCGLCSMVCPVYQQGGNVMMMPHGMAKASQCGAQLERSNVFSCMLCGACAALCPQDIDLMQMLVAMRSAFSDKQAINSLINKPAYQKGKVVFIADKSLANDQQRLDRLMNLLGSSHLVMASDQAVDISEAMQSGDPVSYERMHQFLTSLQPVKKIIISDGLLYQLIKTKLPQIPMQSLGEALSSSRELRKNIKADDLYVIDSQSYHANYQRAVIYYDVLQQATQCHLSLDLHRLAIPTGAQATNEFDQVAQVQWLLQGRKTKRIIAESLADYHMLAKSCKQPVVHISEL